MFLFLSLFKNTAYFTVSAGNIPPGVNPEAYQWFHTVDTDRSGFINLKELKQALVNSNWSAFNDETCLMMISKSQWQQKCGLTILALCCVSVRESSKL